MGWVINVKLQPFYPPGEGWYLSNRRLGGPQKRAAENFAPPGFDPQTVQPVTNRHTDCANSVRALYSINIYFLINPSFKLQTGRILWTQRLLSCVLLLRKSNNFCTVSEYINN